MYPPKSPNILIAYLKACHLGPVSPCFAMIAMKSFPHEYVYIYIYAYRYKYNAMCICKYVYIYIKES